MKKNKKLLNLSIIFLFLFFVLISSAFININTHTTTGNNITPKNNIIIDAGHGGEDGGAVNENGIEEKNINLSISNDIADLLKIFGYNVTQTRKSDTSLTTYGNTVRERKVSDLKNRLNIFDSDNSIVVSIHQNKFPQSKYFGTQIFYSVKSPLSKSLAESIKYTVVSYLQQDNKRECKKADNNIYLLKNTINPAVIVECGFISNSDECKKLLNCEYQKQMSYSITIGLLNFYNTNY